MVEMSSYVPFIRQLEFEKYSFSHQLLLSHLYCNNNGECTQSKRSSLFCDSQTTGKQCDASVFTQKPGSIKIHGRSSLSEEEHALYLKFLDKYGNAVLVDSEQRKDQDWKKYQSLHAKVIYEQNIFLTAAKKDAIENPLMFTLCEEAVQFITDYNRACYRRILSYPRFYRVHDAFSLIPVVQDTTPTTFAHNSSLLEMGMVPVFVFPKINDWRHVKQCCEKLYERFPIEKSFEEFIKNDTVFKTPVSKDVNAARLAERHGIDMVASSSSLKTLFCNSQSCLESTWELPIVIKERCTGDLTQKTIYIDKPFRKCNSAVFEDNLLFYRRAVKASLTHPKHEKSHVFDNTEGDHEHISLAASSTRLLTENKRASNETFPKHSTDAAVAFQETEEAPVLCLNETVDCLVDNGQKTHKVDQGFRATDMKSNSDSEDDRLVIDESEMPQRQRSNSNTAKILCGNELHFIQTNGNLEEDCDTTSGIFEGKESDIDEYNGEASVFLRRSQRIRNKMTNNLCETLKSSVVESVAQNLSSGTENNRSSKRNDYCNYKPPHKECNLTYESWNLGKLSLLVRCSVKGCTHPRRKRLAFWQIEPKMEYRPVVGAEAVSFSECAQQWCKTALKPNCKLARVRINAYTHDIVLAEELDVDQIKLSCATFNLQDCLDSLHNILQRLLLLSGGNYLLSHVAKQELINILEEDKGDENLYQIATPKYDLHMNYKSLMSPLTLTQEKVLWQPICTKTKLYSHIRNWHVPATFKSKGLSNRNAVRKKCGFRKRAQKHKTNQLTSSS